jgi:ribosomal-protein-alanine N-acetyltransferase
MSIVLRAASTADRGFVRDLSAQAFRAFGDYRELLPRWLSEPGVLTFVAVESGERLGFAMLGFYFGDEARTWCYADLLALAVHPAHRRQGIGRRLLARAIEAAVESRRSLDVRELRLTVADSNEAARRLFAAAGFAPDGLDHGRYDGGQVAIRMRRPLR